MHIRRESIPGGRGNKEQGIQVGPSCHVGGSVGSVLTRVKLKRWDSWVR